MFVTSNFFEKPEVKLNKRDILAFTCLRNEFHRLEYFFDYYRSKGVNHFFVVDNGSTDGSFEFLVDQLDVHVFQTKLSYRGSCAGRIWLHELCNFYGNDHWCLTIDVDELFVWPGSERTDLISLCNHLDNHNEKAVICSFLDMYSDKQLSEVLYRSGDNFIETCPFYENYSYRFKIGENAPYFNIFGGPRARRFNAQNKLGPMMKKVPLVKWQQGFSYVYSTHSYFPAVKVSTIMGTILHFKFFNSFISLASAEHKRGDRRQQNDYKFYNTSFTENCCFYSNNSLPYLGTLQLVKNYHASFLEKDEKFIGSESPIKSLLNSDIKKLEQKINSGELISINALHHFWNLYHSIRFQLLKPSHEKLTNNSLLKHIKQNAEIIHYCPERKSLQIYFHEKLIYSRFNSNFVIVTKYAAFCEIYLANRIEYNSNSQMANIYTLVPYKIDKKHLEDMSQNLPSNSICGVEVRKALGSNYSEDKFLKSITNNISTNNYIKLGYFSSLPDCRLIKESIEIIRIRDSKLLALVNTAVSSKFLNAKLRVQCSNELFSLLKLSDLLRASTQQNESKKKLIEIELPLNYFYQKNIKEFEISLYIAETNISLFGCPISIKGSSWDFDFNAQTQKWFPVYWGSKYVQLDEGRSNTLLHK